MQGKRFDSISEIDKFLIDYRNQRALEYHLWRRDRFGIPLPAVYRDLLRKRGQSNGRNRRASKK